MKGKKTGGRKPGVPNKITAEVRQFALAFLNNPKGLAKMAEQYEQGTLPPAILSLLFHYGAGKPTDTLKVEGQLPRFEVIFKDDVSDD
jgi:hypothetical protein